MKEYLKENKKIIRIILILLIITTVLTIIVKFIGNTNKVLLSAYISDIKLEDINLTDDPCDLETVLKYNKIPYFKLNNDLYNELNKSIMTDFLLRSCYQSGRVNYDASINNNILSVAINISYDTVNEFAYVEYKTYNINIKDNTLISNQEILNKFKINTDDVTNTIMKRLNSYYNYEKEHQLIDNDISFTDYLNILQYNQVTVDNMKLYIDKKNDLYIYKDFMLSEGMIKDENFPTISIIFKLS